MALPVSHSMGAEYRYRVLRDQVGYEVMKTVRVYAERQVCEVVELNVQPDHVHFLVKVPPKVSISKLMGVVKGKAAIQVFKQFPYLKKKPCWGNHFWEKGYCVDTVGVDAEMIRQYVKYQERRERNLELDFDYKLIKGGNVASLLRGLAYTPL